MSGHAMAGDAMALVAAWRERAGAALAAGDIATAAAVAREAASVDPAVLQPPTRDLGQALGTLAGELIEVPEPGALETVFNNALRVFQGSSGVQLGDLLATWNNLVALYDKHGAHEHRNQVLAQIGAVAERYDGPLDTASATVFMQLGELFRKGSSFHAMRMMYRQVQRYMVTTPDMPDETLAIWLERFSSGLEDAGAAEEIEPAFQAALAALEPRADLQPLSLAKCRAVLAGRATARGDFTAAAELFERILPVPGIREEERIEVLSQAGRAWYKAGQFDRASRHLVQAVRRRAGLRIDG